MFKHAEALIQHGFITKDIFRMHQDFDFMLPQWLFVLILYYLRLWFGDIAISIFSFAIIFLIGYVFYNLSLLLTGNKKTSLAGVLFLMLIYSVFYSENRPFNISLLLGLCLIYVIEVDNKKNSPHSLFWIFFISVLQINLHNSLWILQLLILLCYWGEKIISVVLRRRNTLNEKRLIIFTLLSLAGGFINPYGVSYMLYIFSSMPAIQKLKCCVGEVNAPSGVRLYLCVVLCIASILSIYVRYKKAHELVPLRFILLSIGFSILSFTAIRNTQFIIVFAQITTLISLSCINITSDLKFIKYFIFIFVFFVLSYFFICTDTPYYLKNDHEKAAHYFVENSIPKDIRVFSTDHCGSALIYEGYKPYYDCMAELYGIENNHKKDIAQEMNSLFSMNDEQFSRFLDDYNFEYAAVNESYFINKFKNLKYWVLLENYGNSYVFKKIE